MRKFFFIIVFVLINLNFSYGNDNLRVYESYIPVENMNFIRNGEFVKSSFYENFKHKDNNFFLLNQGDNTLDFYNKNGKFISENKYKSTIDSPKNIKIISLPQNRSAILDINKKTVKITDFEGYKQNLTAISTTAKSKRRILEFDSKIYIFKEKKVFLDLIKKSVSIEIGDIVKKINYKNLTPHCYVLKTDSSFFLKHPDSPLLLNLLNFEQNYTGEIILNNSEGVSFVLNKSKDEILQYSKTGELVSFFAPMGNRGPYCRDFSLFNDDSIAILDNKDCRIYLYSKEGIRKKVFGVRGFKKSMFQNPVNIVVDAADRIIIRDIKREKGIIFDSEGKFITEMQELIHGNLPEEFRIYLDTENRVHIVDYLRKSHHIIPQSFNYMKELDRVFDSHARFPRFYMTITADGELLYFDSVKNNYEILEIDGNIRTPDFSSKLASFTINEELKFKKIAPYKNDALLLSTDNKPYIMDLNTGKSRIIPIDFEINDLKGNAFGNIFVTTRNGKLLGINNSGKIKFSKNLGKKDFNFIPFNNDLLIFRKNTIKILDTSGKLINSINIGENRKIIDIIPENDHFYIFYDKGGILGMKRYKRKNVYKEAMRYYNNKLYRMAASRFERIINKGLDNPEINYKLYDCYRKLNKEESAFKLKMHIMDKWPDSKEVIDL